MSGEADGPLPAPPPEGWPVLLAQSGLRFDAPPHKSLLASALAAGLKLPSSCRNGTCRACLCQVESGRVVHAIEWPGLSRDEKDEGWILPCVAQARSALVLRRVGPVEMIPAPRP